MGEAFTTDGLLDGRLRLRQPARGHRAGTDALLLAALARGLMGQNPRPGLRIADFGAGVGSAGLALAVMEPSALVTLLERQPYLADQARANVLANALGRADVIEADITDARALRDSGLPPASIDIVIMNPPFFEPGTVRASPIAQRRVSHVMGAGTAQASLADWMTSARRALAPKGRLALIHRAEALAQVLAALEKGFGAVRILPVQPNASSPAHRILVSATLGARTPLALLPPLALHGDDGAFTPAVEAIHRRLTPL
jgi:tRNA1(Val) A37 N6-methylase TrmN6